MPSQADAIIAEIESVVHRLRNDLAVEVTANLMEPPDEGGTPVKTGWARANWIPSVGEPQPDAVGEAGDAASAGASQQAGIAAVASNAGDEPNFVTNNVPYIQQLNDGSSRQAPSGFVEAAIDRAVQAIAGGKKPETK